MLDKPSEEAAQMAVNRALVRLASEMGRKPLPTEGASSRGFGPFRTLKMT